jgi:ribosome-associated protein
MNDEFDLENDDIDDAEFVYDGPSKSQRKRDADALQKLGEELIALKPSELAQFDLPDNLLKAIEEARKLHQRGSLKRQRQYIGKLMRNVDAAQIAQKMEELRSKHDVHSAQFKRLEIWRQRILDEGNEAINELLEEYPQADRQYLRQLQRNCQKEQAAGQPPASARQLFRYLRELAEAD